MRLLVLLALTLSPIPAELAAQDQNTTIASPIINEITVSPTPFVNNITVMSDSARAVNLRLNNELLRERIAQERECACGTPGWVRAGQAGLVAAVFFVGWQLRGIKNKEHPPHEAGDVNVTLPTTHGNHGHGHDKPHGPPPPPPPV